MDNGLSERGKAQSLEIAETLFAKLSAGKKPLILSSSKNRCVETVAPLAGLIGVDVEISPLLMEQVYGESEQSFLGRIDSFISEWKSSMPDVVIACSHGDVLPLMIEKISGTQRDLFKGEWVELKF